MAAQIIKSLPSFFYRQLLVTPTLPSRTWAAKTVIITGANTGLGLEAARHFLTLNVSHLILAVRDPAKGAAAKASLLQQANSNPTSPHNTTTIEIWDLDLSSYASVQAFAARVTSTLPRIDAVLLNAGIMPQVYAETEGSESTITTNVLSTFLLAFLLLPHLKTVAERHSIRPVVSVTASDVHFLTAFPERDAQPSILAELSNEKTARMGDRYNVSKLLEVFLVREFGVRFPAETYPVTLNCLTPGWCVSQLDRDMDTSNLLLRGVKKALQRTTEVGGRTLVAAVAAGPESHGEYMSECAVAGVAPLVTSEEGRVAQKRVWDEVCAKLEEISPGVVAGI